MSASECEISSFMAGASPHPGIPGRSSRNKEVKWDTLFFEDTVELMMEPPRLGIVTKTWHGIDEPDSSWLNMRSCVPGRLITDDEFFKFRRTALPPKHFCLFLPASPEYPPMLVHESELKLLDRALSFGDTVKRSLSDTLSGTVTAFEVEAELRHCFPKMESDPEDYVDQVVRVSDLELVLATEWHKGNFVVFKNSWMGIVEDVEDEVVIRLENGTVVVPEKMELLEIPIQSEDACESSDRARERAGPSFAWRPTIKTRSGAEKAKEEEEETKKEEKATSKPASPPGFPFRSVPLPEVVPPGTKVTTTRANLRRGRWLIGTYNPKVPPTGVVVQVNILSLDISWISQNVMANGRFIPVPRPPVRLEQGELEHLTKLKKSSCGSKRVDGRPFEASDLLQSAEELRVGDRVRFIDLNKAIEEHKGAIRKIDIAQTSGYDVNTFLVIGMKSKVRVLWQDMTETVEEAKNVVPYSNVDDHEVWPGEVVVIQPEPSEAKAIADGLDEVTNFLIEIFQPTDLFWPKKVGIVQKVRPKERVASVKWYENPSVGLNNSSLFSGSRTGELAEGAEEISLYDVVAHAAVSIRRGDIVLIVPESIAEQLLVTSGSNNVVPEASGLLPIPSQGQRYEPTRQLRDAVVRVDGMLMRLSATLSGHPLPVTHSELDILIRTLMDDMPSSNEPERMGDSAGVSKDNSIDWVGEVVELGTDGLITVRLSALKVPREVRVPLERLRIVLSGDRLDLSDGFESDEEEEDDDTEGTWYQDGERVENDDEWLTDDDEEGDEGEDRISTLTMPVVDYDEMNDGEVDDVPALEDVMDVEFDSGNDLTTETPTPATTTTTSTDSKLEESTSPVPDTTPEHPSARPRFLILDTSPPPDHAFASRPPTATTTSFLRRISREHSILSTSLPDGIFVRAFESRLDLLRVLIIGPANTPYELAPFVFDFYFPATFPRTPPVAHFHSWTGGVGRVNPNLYEDGKICLSLLGTWHAERHSEAWNENLSTVLQVVVSLRGLVLVNEPYFNEAGYNVYVGTPEAALNSALYSEKAYILARGFVKHVLEVPIGGLEDVIKWLYLPGSEGPELLKEVVEKAKVVVERSEKEEGEGQGEVGSEGVGRVTEGALVLLKRCVGWLERNLADLESVQG